jgi:hypothetical protein
MTKQAEKTDQPGAATRAEELVIPDESDRIIADLRAQLHTLQEQLALYRRADGEPASAAQSGRLPASGAGKGGAGLTWSDEWAPGVAARLREPAQDLTARLERLIEQAQDPALRRELEHCLETAFYLFATLRHIGDNHRLLLESLEEGRARCALDALREGLQAELAVQGTSITPETAGSVPGRPAQVPQCLVSVAAKVARIAAELIGQVIRVTIAYERAPAGGTPGDGICITIACAGTREELIAMDNASQLVFKPDVSAITVVDWLYMEKIVDLQGGSLRLYHRGDRAAGFQVRIPVDRSRDLTEAAPDAS